MVSPVDIFSVRRRVKRVVLQCNPGRGLKEKSGRWVSHRPDFVNALRDYQDDLVTPGSSPR